MHGRLVIGIDVAIGLILARRVDCYRSGSEVIGDWNELQPSR